MNIYQGLNASEVSAARLVASLKYQKPPDTLVSEVMNRIAPSTRVRKFSLLGWLFAPKPIRIAPIWPISGMVAAMMIVAAMAFSVSGTANLEHTLLHSGTAMYSEDTFHVFFSFENPDVESVSILGSFNDWNPAGHVMTQSEDGTWTITIPLPQGSHEYAFLINNDQIIPDPDALLFKDDGFGSVNSMIVIEDPGYEQQT
ncbi:isoamylase early set domain-containing protein [Desulfonatronovibrio magnus]|uniref:isoamylase early set domain-containing protein n=1 Tax=Desulfonatronovibrio magnus TaxID=698827 RepID=UPI000697853B|nr:isoamylase early set domain-containing protein [Desulfonatronovibrio magnus]